MLKILYSVYRYLFARSFFVKFNKFLYHCSIKGLGVYNYENMNISGENNFLKKYIKKDSLGLKDYVVFDVGAIISGIKA